MIDPILMQRCIDGELNEAEQQALIRALDAQQSSEGWRLLALEYMEEQVLRIALQDCSDVWRREGILTSGLDHAASATAALESPPRQSNQAGFRRMWPLIAASLVVGLLSGAFGARLLPTDLADEQVVDARLETDRNPGSFTVDNDAQLDLSNSTEMSSYPIPDSQFSMSPDVQVLPVNLFDSSSEHLLENGWELRQQPHNFRVRLENGREAIVPGHSVRVIPAVQ